MNSCAPDELSNWLAGRLAQSPVVEYIPAANLALVTRQIVAACYKDGRLETADFLTWFENEFQVPRETLLPVMSGLKKDAAKLGVILLLPWETHASVQSPTPPAASSQPASATPAARPSRPAPAKPPPAPEELESVQHLADTRYLERTLFDYIVFQKPPEDLLAARMLVTYFQLSPEEVELLKTVEIDNPGDSLAAWVLRLDGLTLGLHLADLLVEDMPDRQADWSRGIRHLQTRISETTTALLGRQQKARNEKDPATPLLMAAWNQLRQTADALDKRIRIATGKEPPPPPPPTPKPAKQSQSAAAKEFGALNTRNKLILAAAAVAVIASIVISLSVLGVFSPGLKKVEVKLDTAGLALPVMGSYTEGAGMVVMVDEKAWGALPDSGKIQFLLGLYDRAVRVNADQVQVRGGDKILAQAWSHDNFKLFARKK